MFYIFTTKKEAEAYDAEVTALSNYPSGDNWANPRKHPTLEKWAILCNSKVVLEEQATLDRLPDDWFPPVEEL